MKRWEAYHQRVGNAPNSLVVGCLNDFVTRRGASLDLGAGNLRDSKFLLGQGFSRVVAVDVSEESREFLVEGIELHIQPIETFVPKRKMFDFIFSCNTLFFLSTHQVVDVFRNALRGLRSGGVFACNVLGEEDDWVVQGREVSSFTEEALVSLAGRFEILGTSESKNTASYLNEHGFLTEKFWHQLAIVVQKP